MPDDLEQGRALVGHAQEDAAAETGSVIRFGSSRVATSIAARATRTT
jgi:hypothetical protein